MRESAPKTYNFKLGRVPYRRVRLLGWGMIALMLACSALFICAGMFFWNTYAHDFTLYLKWQDALLAVCWFIGGIALISAGLIARFLYAAQAGYTHGMITLRDQENIAMRDLSPENITSIFWLMNSIFWCFTVVLVSLAPTILIQWALHIPNPALAIITTCLAVLFCLATLVVGIISGSFIIIGFTGMVSFTRKMGAAHVYRLNDLTTVRIDNFVLTVMYPGETESMVDLHLLTQEDQRRLLSLLYRRWMETERSWNPDLGEEIFLALETTEVRVPVSAIHK